MNFPKEENRASLLKSYLQANLPLNQKKIWLEPEDQYLKI